MTKQYDADPQTTQDDETYEACEQAILTELVSADELDGDGWCPDCTEVEDV